MLTRSIAVNIFVRQDDSLCARLEDRLAHRLDMSAPLLVFCGLFVVAVAICGTMEARGPFVVEDVKASQNENVIGPVEMDLVAGCDAAGSLNSTDNRYCQDRRAIRAASAR